MKILCTGGSGFIGTHLIDNLLARGIDLINVDIAKPNMQTYNTSWRECNILDLDTLDKSFYRISTFPPNSFSSACLNGRKKSE